MREAGSPAIPKESKTKQSLILAVLVHLVLFACLGIGVSWRSDEQGTVVAEVWDISPTQAAPRPAVPERTLPEPEPQPEEKPVEKAPELPEVKTDPDPEIRLREEEKKRQEEQKKIEEQNRAEERRKAAQEAQRRQQALADQKRVDQLMAEERERLAARSGTGGTGTAAFTAGGSHADAGYIQQVGAKIKSNTIFNVPDGLSGNPPVEYAVELLPDGSIKSIVKRKSSGVPGFDEAVLRAVEKSAPFPPDRTGRVPPRFDISHRPKG